MSSARSFSIDVTELFREPVTELPPELPEEATEIQGVVPPSVGAPVPLPDPFAILEHLTDGRVRDPLRAAIAASLRAIRRGTDFDVEGSRS